MSHKISRLLININGIVQGVGFRPFVYNLAVSLGIRGYVCNNTKGVFIEAEGMESSLENFIYRLQNNAPPLSYIDQFEVKKDEPTGYNSFTIKESSCDNVNSVYISPDVSVCEDCLKDLNSTENKRYQYPFINCTNCGPRFTIIQNTPYDRPFTTMSEFPMCEACMEEYHNPADRRFHAQPIACSKCGPKLSLLDSKGNVLSEGREIDKVIELLSCGNIVAIKGLGGYHLACDATNSEAVGRLRKRKFRDGKPFALMAKNIETVYKYCRVSSREQELLQGIRKPIVLLKAKEDIELPKDSILTDSDRLGIMLPYTPLHYLLFKDSLELLVMTSGNKAGEPIYYKDNEALEGLAEIADYFLTHNRQIFIRTDDSVTSVFRDKEYIIRRSRGYVPFPIDLSAIIKSNAERKNNSELPSVIACGGELKNTYCITKDSNAFLSHHIGDLENFETLESFESGIEHFKRIFAINPSVVAFDKHPEYLSTKYADGMGNIIKLPVQHHHAHIASCMAENGIVGSVIGVAFDGTGYGDDGHIWGGEFFTGNYLDFKRAAHFDYVPLPGGAVSIKEPWRMAVSYLLKYCADELSYEKLEFLKNIEQGKLSLLRQQIAKKINSPLTSSVGRLFDAVSSLLGLCSFITYEGQAAILLEKAASIEDDTCYPYEIAYINEKYVIKPDKLIHQIIHDYISGQDIAKISGIFHNTIASITLDVCNILRDQQGLSEVVLSGGVFQNRLLLELVVSKLSQNGFGVYTHSRVPANDGGISLGQAAIAICKYNNFEF